MNQDDQQKQAQAETNRFRGCNVCAVRMNDGRVLLTKNRFGVQGRWFPTPEQWETTLQEMRTLHGDFVLWEMSEEDANRILKGRVNLW